MISRRVDPFSSHDPVALVFNCHVNGLGIIRSLGEERVPVLALDHNLRAVGLASRYATGLVCPNPKDDQAGFIAFLLDVASGLRRKGVLYPTNDTWLMAVSDNRERLERFYEIPFSGPEVIRRCAKKEEMYESAKEVGIPIPETLVLTGLRDAERVKRELRFPCVVKPAVPWRFPAELGSRVRICSSWSELRDWLAANDDQIVRENVRLIAQEKIPGGADCLYTFASYSDRTGDVVDWGVIRKIAQHPPEAGTIRMGEVVTEEAVAELGRRFVAAIGFHGLANTEFKKDPRDGVFKLMEINPRSGMSNCFATRSGSNLAYLAYCDAIGRMRPTRDGKHRGRVHGRLWVVLLAAVFDILQRTLRHPLRTETVRRNVRELRLLVSRRKILAVCSLRDPLPGLAFFWWNLQRLVRRDWREQRDLR